MILDALRKRWPWLKHLFADDGYDRTQLMDKAVFLDFIIEIVRMAFARVSGGAHSGHQSNGDKMTSYRLVYTSSRNSSTKLDLQQLIQTSRRNGAQVAVTGFLLFDGDVFAQALGHRERDDLDAPISSGCLQKYPTGFDIIL